MAAKLCTYPTPDAIGDAVAERLVRRIAAARGARKPFLLGCPTGRTPRPIFAALARHLAAASQDISHVVLVMMDEYLVPGSAGLEYAPAGRPWSCHHFARVEIADRVNAGLTQALRLRDDALWFPEPHDPEAYDGRIADAGGIDVFLLASGASDGHVAFNPPGSPRDSRTRIIPLSEETRRDNLQTFPAFGTLAAVPRYGISVGIDTIISSKEALMIVWGAGKRVTFTRIVGTDRYQSDWPATLIHECSVGEILADADAASASGDTPAT